MSKLSEPKPSAPSSRPASQSRASVPAPFYCRGVAIDGRDALNHAVVVLRQADPGLIDHLLEVGGEPPLRRREPGFAGLAAIIVSQQVSTASADAIFGRLAAAITPLTAETLIEASDEVLRAVGLSGGKVRTLRTVAVAMLSGTLRLAALGTMSAEDAHRTLVSVNGIGPWTADVFLLFCLGHPDAWPAGDIALQEALRIVLRLEARPGIAELHRLAEPWRPYRGVMARMLWAYYRVSKAGGRGMSLA